MPAKSAYYLVAYDVSEDAERDQVAQVLKGFGFRVQKSVFECRLSASGKGQLAGRLRALELKSGYASIYRISAGSKREDIGQAPPRAHDEDTEYAFLF